MGWLEPAAIVHIPCMGRSEQHRATHKTSTSLGRFASSLEKVVKLTPFPMVMRCKHVLSMCNVFLY